MNKGKGCSTFLLIILLVLVAFIGIYLFAPELLTEIRFGSSDNAAFNFSTNLIKPFTDALSSIGASISNFFAGFQAP